MDNKCDVKEVANLAGIAAFATSDFATAEKYLGLAESQGYYKSAPKEDEVAKIGEFYLQAIPYYKKAWAREKAFRARDAKARPAARGAEDQQGRYRTRTVRGSGPEHRGQLHQSGAERILQERYVPPRA